jgi:hypothetical protein
MAFKRIIELNVLSGGNQLVSIADLHIEFDISRSTTLAENTGSFVIYNAKESTRKNILQKDNYLIFKAGHEDNVLGTIFMGNIDTSISEQSGPDWITNVTTKTVQSQTTLDNTYVAMSYVEDTLLSRPLQEIAAALGLAVYGLDNANFNLENGFVFVGAARGALDKCIQILEPQNVSLYIDQNELVIYNVGDRTSRFSPVYLDYESGLIRAYEITEDNTQSKEKPKRIGFESLIIPKLTPRGLITIKSDKINGTFQIDKLNFTGDNFGGDNRAIGEAIE